MAPAGRACLLLLATLWCGAFAVSIPYEDRTPAEFFTKVLDVDASNRWPPTRSSPFTQFQFKLDVKQALSAGVYYRERLTLQNTPLIDRRLPLCNGDSSISPKECPISVMPRGNGQLTFKRIYTGFQIPAGSIVRWDFMVEGWFHVVLDIRFG